MGGRYVEHTWKGKMMDMPFEGRGTEAYDNVAKQYVNSWVDNMGTGIIHQTGTCDDAVRSLHLPWRRLGSHERQEDRDQAGHHLDRR